MIETKEPKVNKVRLVGNSLVLTLPRSIASEGETYQIKRAGRGKIILVKKEV